MGQSGSSPAEEASRPEHLKPTDDKVEKYKELKPDEVPPDNAKVILIIGAAGAGKTSLVRLATGANISVGNGTEAGTVTCQTYVATIQHIQLAFIDCPGLNGDDNDSVKIGWIGRYICDLFRHGRSLHGILYLHDINVVRESPAMERCLKFVEVITETAGYPNVAFVTTKWDRLSPNGRIACDRDHNTLTQHSQWQTFRNHGARDIRHDGLDDLPNPSNAASQAAQASLLNVLRLYLNNPSKMSLHLETQFRQRNQDIDSTARWLLSHFEGQQTTVSSDSNNNSDNDKGSFSPWVIALAIGATISGAYVSTQGGPFRARPTWDGIDKPGFRIYYDDDKKAKFYESWADDIYREQRNKYPFLPEGRPSKLFQPKQLDIDVNNPTRFRWDPEFIPNPYNSDGRFSSNGMDFK